MKKIIIAVIAALGMISATVTFADALNGAAGKKAAAAAQQKVDAKLYPVDVVVLNRTDNAIQVQNGNNVYNMNSGDFIRFPSNVGNAVPLTIYRIYDSRLLLNGSVCNRAVVTVKYDMFGDPKAYVDGTQCYK